MAEQLLSGITVVECGNMVSAAYTGKLLADLWRGCGQSRSAERRRIPTTWPLSREIRRMPKRVACFCI